MDTLTINNAEIKVNEEGYFTDPSQWSEDIAIEMAKKENIDLTDKHFEVLNFLRSKHAEEVPLSIRKVGKSGVVNIKEFYALFPGGPLKISSKIAGIPKPVSCV
ncbi:tRNA 2-thiouridine synthesizing protein E [Marivirga sericea]|uniref:tRNA 2-thiouridine synthesizing protein E n=1 Tax=Marivirga sericea TaxID=1028 RepID=A0A1X7IFG5_9BACT|nr:TusE/DsrC/DsvC family sulfur relay protein [Marivirga sericea]SMG13351.1 tRNA 2-thiouridine synthesizing protein E [Marivirga sericea]